MLFATKSDVNVHGRWMTFYLKRSISKVVRTSYTVNLNARGMKRNTYVAYFNVPRFLELEKHT